MTLAVRRIDTTGYAKIARPPGFTFGKLPKLQWVFISELAVDPEYQRDITRIGRTNVRRIAETFNWSMFSPVVVAPVGGNRFAIIDGQHRTTAAALCGFERVPCMIVACEPGEQAAAFRAINGNTTRLHSVQIYHAAIAAKEEWALSIAKVCRAADVSIARSPVPIEGLPPGVALSAVTIHRMIVKFGAAITTDALIALRKSDGDVSGALRNQIIHGAVEVLSERPEWRRDRARLIAAFEQIDLLTMFEEARVRAARTRGTSTTVHFKAALIAALERQFSRARVRR